MKPWAFCSEFLNRSSLYYSLRYSIGLFNFNGCDKDQAEGGRIQYFVKLVKTIFTQVLESEVQDSFVQL